MTEHASLADGTRLRDRTAGSLGLCGSRATDPLGHVRAGHRPDPTGTDLPLGLACCQARTEHFACTRAEGHIGQHIAGDGDEVRQVWPNSPTSSGDDAPAMQLPEPDSARPDGLAWWTGSPKHSVTRLANGEVRLSCQPDGPAVDDPRALGLALIAAADYSVPPRALVVGEVVERIEDFDRLPQDARLVGCDTDGQPQPGLRVVTPQSYVHDGAINRDEVESDLPLLILTLPEGGAS